MQNIEKVETTTKGNNMEWILIGIAYCVVLTGYFIIKMMNN